MSKIAKAFENKKAFIPFLTVGDPNGDKTVEFVLEMERAGADLVELGIPFSDPTAEGVVIQNANIRALSGGMKLSGVFEVVRKIREKTQIPLVFLTYLNPVFHYGYEAFFAKCRELGVDGMICPDLPYEERDEVADIAKKYDVDLIALIAPTSEERIQMIAKEASGYIYIVSSMGVTGVRSKITTDLGKIVSAIRQVTDVPCAIGFGISTPQQAKEMAEIADGAIVGSAIVKIIAQYGEKAAPHVYEYVKLMKEAL
ncbi:MAG: tryptophan synthase subunit alpha [Lachnospiraceae bacterium]|nr:tryptophan synthase subunit alpha [Lachnospiraceae bacterium]